MSDLTLNEIQSRLRAFRDAREWGQFHNPKDLSAAIAVEAAKLQELFLWLSVPAATQLVMDERERVSEELADVMIQCLNFVDIAGIDVVDAISRKIELNESKYPIDKSRGSSVKYTDL